MSWIESFGERARRLRAALAIGAVAIVAAAIVAGCGSDDSSTDTAGGAGGGSATTTEPASSESPTVSADELQETVDTVLETDAIGADSLPPLMKAALERATPEPDKATLDKAMECWEATSCTVGDGPITLGLADGFGDNTWRQFSKMSVILQALTYPEVGEIITTNAHGELATFQANLRSLTAQGVEALIVYNDFGPAAYPALQAAQREGATVSTYVGPNDGAPPTAITTRVQPDVCAAGKEMARVTEEAIGGTGPVSYFTGVPGNPQDVTWQKCATEEGIESVFEGETDWTPAGAQKAASALIASGKPVKAILYSYSNPVPSIVKTYLKAKEDIPAIVTWTQNNETTCQWIENPYDLYQTNALNWVPRVSVTAVMSKIEGEEVPPAVIYPMPFNEANKASCDPDRPAEYPGPSAFVPETLTNQMLAGS